MTYNLSSCPIFLSKASFDQSISLSRFPGVIVRSFSWLLLKMSITLSPSIKRTFDRLPCILKITDIPPSSSNAKLLSFENCRTPRYHLHDRRVEQVDAVLPRPSKTFRKRDTRQRGQKTGPDKERCLRIIELYHQLIFRLAETRDQREALEFLFQP